MKTIDLLDLTAVTGGATVNKAPLSGDVAQNIIGWGGRQEIHNHNYSAPAAVKPPTTRLEYLRLHPEARVYKQIPLRPFGR